MIRLFFVFTLILFSCGDSSKEFEPSVYQMSEADSVRCMEEILDGIIKEAKEWQLHREKMDEYLYKSGVIACGFRDVFSIWLNGSGNLLVQSNLDSVDLVEETYQYFMFNRNLSRIEMEQASMNPLYEGFDEPFYVFFNLDEINRRIAEESEKLEEIKTEEDVDPAVVDYYLSRVEDWEVRKRTLQILGTNSYSQVASWAFVDFGYHKENEKSRSTLNEIAYAFYQMRNYECLRYFDETYLALYERADRLNKENDREKLEILRTFHPAHIICRDRSKPYTGFVEDPPKSVN